MSCLDPTHSTHCYLLKQELSKKGYHFLSHHASFFMLLYFVQIMTSQFNKKLISPLGKKNRGKKTPREDCELGYSDFTLTLTFYLPNPNKNNM